MNLTQLSSRNTFFLLLLLLLLRLITIIADDSFDPQHAIALNCGFLRNSTAIDGRQWVGEADSATIVSFNGSGSKSVITSSDDPSQSLDPTPYRTARASRSSFTYTFRVGSGYKFIRLHFYPASYSSFKRSAAFFTVKSGQYTLLNTFLPLDSLHLKSIVKEFTLYVPDDGKPLSITFSPSKESIPSVDTFAFVNGIEVVPMPLGLYYTMEGDAGAYLVEQNYRFPLGKDTAMEMVYRLNVGGIKLSPLHDPSMLREWADDSNHIIESGVFPINSINRIKYMKTSKDGAPQRLYQSSWSMKQNFQEGEIVSFTWKMPVNLGFRYLIRLHFCELDYDVVKENKHREFNILINNHMVESRGDLIKWGGEIGVAIHKDYLTTLRGDRMMGKRDLVVALYPSNEDQSTKFIDSILKGIEVFKLSNPDDNLAGGNSVIFHSLPPVLSHPLASTKRGLRIPTSINEIIIWYIILVVIVHQLCEWKEIVHHPFCEWRERCLSKDSSLIVNKLCRRFSFTEIQLATNNFDKRLEIGHGGFGKVYKGVINDKDKMIVAIKRLDSKSEQGKKEFLSEIDTLSKFRHKHLVSLIGYCNDGREMILIYEYMERGTLADHLHKNKRDGSSKGDTVSLTWKERLNICLGAAHGLDYLHNKGVIHRDVKSENILLDLNWVAKISDFGLCKVGGATSFTHIITDVKGTIGYMDPEYYTTNVLTKKSDVYAFGVVLWEVLCGRSVIDNRIEDEQLNLVKWVQHCCEKKLVDKIIDSSLKEEISTNSLKVYVDLANLCLHKDSNIRPTMAEVIKDLNSLFVEGLNFLRDLDHKAVAELWMSLSQREEELEKENELLKEELEELIIRIRLINVIEELYLTV